MPGGLNNRRAAIDAWKLVLNLDQNNLPTATPAAAALEALYAETNDVANLVKTLQLQARWADGAARKKLLFRIAGLEEKSLGDTEAAVATLRSILEADPQDHPPSMRSIASSRREPTTASGWRSSASESACPATRRRGQELWRSVASLLEKDVGDVDEAIAACVSILDENPRTIRRSRPWRGSTNSRGATAIGWRSSSAGWPCASRRMPSGFCSSSRSPSCWRGRSGTRRAALERWREALDGAPNDAEALVALERFLAPGTDAGLRLAARASPRADLRKKGGRYAALAAIVRIYVEAESDVRARLGQLDAALGHRGVRGSATPRGRCRRRRWRSATPSPSRSSRRCSTPTSAWPAPSASPRSRRSYRDISPDVLDEALKLRSRSHDRRRGRGAG